MYQVELSPKAEKDLRKIHTTSYYLKIGNALIELGNNPVSGDVKPLKSFKYAQFRKLQGNYRILFDINYDEKLIIVYRILHRKDAYR